MKSNTFEVMFKLFVFCLVFLKCMFFQEKLAAVRRLNGEEVPMERLNKRLRCEESRKGLQKFDCSFFS